MRRMKRVVAVAAAVAALLVLARPHVEAGEGAQPAETDVAAARAAVKDLGEKLKGELVAALKAGGPDTALGVCRTAAAPIAETVSNAHGFDVGRTALKVRNPENAPDAFERRVLEAFVASIADGADPAALEHVEVVSQNGKREFRYMKAIPTAAEPCLACHGADVDPGLKARILELYPTDEATGFEAGELRGAFTVRRALD